jgi:hypothetical protein
MVEQPPASLGELHAATVAQKQRLVQLHLQRAHLAAQSRLRHAQHEGGLAEAPVLGDVNEGFELIQVHFPVFPQAMPKLYSS